MQCISRISTRVSGFLSSSFLPRRATTSVLRVCSTMLQLTPPFSCQQANCVATSTAPPAQALSMPGRQTNDLQVPLPELYWFQDPFRNGLRTSTQNPRMPGHNQQSEENGRPEAKLVWILLTASSGFLCFFDTCCFITGSEVKVSVQPASLHF